MTVQQVAMQFAEQFLWADPDWLLEHDDGFSYWQHRLEQRVMVEQVDSAIKWRIGTLVVANVQDLDFARRVCLGLNTQAMGWSFVVHDESRSVHAICSLSAPPDWDRLLLILAEAAKFSAWFSDLIAERLAQVLGGVPAFSHHPQQSGLRTPPDGVYWYVQARRDRPEFWLDPLPWSFPRIEEIANTFAASMGPVADEVAVSGRNLQVTTLNADGSAPSHWMQAGFFDNALFGTCWASVVTLRGSFKDESARVANDLAWMMFDDARLSLQGAWVRDQDGLQYAMSVTTSALRGMEQLASFAGHTAQELWSVTSLLSNGIQAYFESGLEPLDSGDGSDEPQLTEVSYVLGAFHRDCLRAVEDLGTNGRGTKADRRLLWFDRAQPIVTWAIFNPVGPTLSTLAICGLSDAEGLWVVELMRHPLLPAYRIVAEVRELSEVPDVLAELFTSEEYLASIPDMIDMTYCPVFMTDEVKWLLRQRVLQIAAEQGVDLAMETAAIVDSGFQPWKRLDLLNDESYGSGQPVRGSAVTGDDQRIYDEWFGAVTSGKSIASHAVCLGEAWDGAINYQRSRGDGWARNFDVGEFVITYSDVGVME